MIPHAKVRAAVRKLWMWSPERREALKRAKATGKGYYRCELCDVFTQKPSVDHKIALGSTPGARGASEDASWDRLLERLFCDPSGLRVLCKQCHDEITKEQRRAKVS